MRTAGQALSVYVGKVFNTRDGGRSAYCNLDGVASPLLVRDLPDGVVAGDRIRIVQASDAWRVEGP